MIQKFTRSICRDTASAVTSFVFLLLGLCWQAFKGSCLLEMFISCCTVGELVSPENASLFVPLPAPAVPPLCLSLRLPPQPASWELPQHLGILGCSEAKASRDFTLLPTLPSQMYNCSTELLSPQLWCPLSQMEVVALEV